MAKKDINLVLDTIESDYSPVGVVKQLDSVIFNITVTENSVIKSLNNQNIKLFAKKPDKTKVEQTEGINITNSINGELTIDLKNSALQAVGLVYFELELKDSEGTISTANFILRVDEKLGSDEAIESTNEFDTFEKIELEEQKRQEAEKERNKFFKELITEGTELNGSLNDNIDLAENLNTSLDDKISKAELINSNLEANNQTATLKKDELETSLSKTEKFIAGLDGSQNIPQIRFDLDEALKAVDDMEINFRDVNNKINKKLDKDGIVTMANMGQDVREAMTGGSVPVVGEDSVDSINLKDGSVTLSKINTDTKEYIDGKLEKLKLENLILNSTFDSIDNWILTAARAETENNICTLTATSQWGNIKTNISPNFSEGDLVYISATIKTNTPNVKLEFGDYITSGYPAISLEISPSQEYTDVSGVVKINSNFANKELSCCIVDHNSSNWQPIYIKGVTVINLTKEFNGATENINKETIDNIIKNSAGALFFKNIIYLNSISTDITPSLRDSIIEEKHIKGKSISLEKLNDDVLNLINTSSKNDKNNLKVLAESNNYVRIISNYSKNDNLSIFLQRTGSNNIFNIKKGIAIR